LDSYPIKNKSPEKSMTRKKQENELSEFWILPEHFCTVERPWSGTIKKMAIDNDIRKDTALLKFEHLKKPCMLLPCTLSLATQLSNFRRKAVKHQQL